MELLTDPQAWLAFSTLVALEVVLGIDNIIFISILADKLPPERREAIRRIGLLMAMFMRIGLLALLAWMVGLTAPLFEVFDQEFSGRDLILIGGGLFLMWKSTTEIHQLLEGEEGEASSAVRATVAAVLAQIVVIDLVFSLDSIITAAAHRLRCEQIVIGSSRKDSLTRWIESSTTNKVLELTTVPVEVIAGDSVSRWERYGIPAGVGALIALLLAAVAD